MTDLIHETEGQIAHVTFNRPAQRNALTFEMYEGLAAISGLHSYDSRGSKDLGAIVLEPTASIAGQVNQFSEEGDVTLIKAEDSIPVEIVLSEDIPGISVEQAGQESALVIDGSVLAAGSETPLVVTATNTDKNLAEEEIVIVSVEAFGPTVTA